MPLKYLTSLKMADQIKEVTKKGYGNRIVDSIKGISFGIILFLASFNVLYWNEGRVNLADVAVNAVQVSADQVDAAMDGKQVYVAGKVVADSATGDGLYLKAGDYLAIEREVEMYSWVEQQSSQSDSSVGGSETTTTTYNYVRDWTSTPSSSANFKVPEGHSNPAKSIDGQTFYANGGKIGVYDIDLSKLELPKMSKLTMNEENTSLTSGYLKGGYVYIPGNAANTFEAPGVGDMRVSYSVLSSGINATVFGKLEGSAINTFVDFDNDNASVYKLFAGSRDEAIATFDSENNFMTWVLRVVGFLAMWAGLSMLFAPLSVLLDIVPFLGKLSGGVIGLITFLVSLLLSVITILISMILHNVIAVVVSALVVVGVFVYILKKKGSAGAASVKA